MPRANAKMRGSRKNSGGCQWAFENSGPREKNPTINHGFYSRPMTTTSEFIIGQTKVPRDV